MTIDEKNEIILKNKDNTVFKIKELSEISGVPVIDVETYFAAIIERVLSNDLIEIDDDMSDIYEILDYVTHDLAYEENIAEDINIDSEDQEIVKEFKKSCENREVKTLDDSLDYFLKEKYSYAFESEEMTEEEYNEAIEDAISRERKDY